MNYAVVTGASRGLGHSIAMFFLEAGIHVVGISRNKAQRLSDMAEENNVTYSEYLCDLSDVEQLEPVFEQIAEEIFQEDTDAVYLVNNAAMLDPIGPATDHTAKQVSKHIQINTVAPIALTNMFLNRGTAHNITLIGVIITSGAASRPVYGWSAYCSSKASVNMYVKTVALEASHLQSNHKVIAFNPGVMDTEMQEKIRASSKETFRDVETFRGYKKDNQLSDTDMVGSIIVDIMSDEGTIENGKIYDIRDYT